MPRRSSASREIIRAKPNGSNAVRMDAPLYLTQEQTAVWDAIVGEMPADWFKIVDVPDLATLCILTVDIRQHHIDLNDAKQKKMYDRRHIRDLNRTISHASKDIARLKRQMRLTHQSIQPKTALNKIKRNNAEIARQMRNHARDDQFA